MKINRYLIASITGLLAASAWADSAPKVLNLNLPPTDFTAANPNTTAAKTTAKVARAPVTQPSATSMQSATPSATRTNMHYDAAANAIVDAADSHKSACDDANYGKPQIHGDIGLGVVAGNHVSGNYQTGTFNVTKATGSCDNPSGSMGLSISVSRGNFNGRGRRGRHW